MNIYSQNDPWNTFDISEQARKNLIICNEGYLLDSDVDEELEKDERFLRIVAKGYSVINASQVEGNVDELPVEGIEHQRIASSEAFFLNLRSDVRFDGNVASYSLLAIPLGCRRLSSSPEQKVIIL